MEDMLKKLLDNPYVISSAINSVASLLNNFFNTGRSNDSQRSNIERQLEHQRQLHNESYKQQIANQLRSFALSVTWPLDTAPDHVADMLDNYANIPLILIVAPVAQNGIQKELQAIWKNLGVFFMTTFAANSETPVIQVGYKTGVEANPTQDVHKIYSGLKSIPVLYISPYSTDRDSVLGISIAFWGTSETHTMPAAQNLEFDIRKMYIDEIREETEKYRKICDEMQLQIDPNTDVAKNIPIFQEEEKYLSKGLDFNYLDQNLNFYKGVRPTRATFATIAQKFLPVVKLLTVSVADMYFCLTYCTEPRLPGIVPQCGNIPDLLLRGDGTDQFFVVTGAQYLNDLLKSYSTILATNLNIDFAVKLLPVFQKMSLPGTECYESELLQSIIPSGLSPREYSAEQRHFLELLGRQTQTSASPTQKQMLETWRTYEEGSRGSVDLGLKYLHGDGVEQNAKEAVRIFTDLGGDPDACYYLGLCYKDGVGVSQSVAKAVEFFKKAVAQNHPGAMVELAVYFLLNPTEDPKHALDLLLRAAEQDNAEALLCLGECYGWGLGVERDCAVSEKYFRRSADLGNVDAIVDMLEISGICYSEKEEKLSDSMLKIISDACRFLPENCFYVKEKIPSGKLYGAIQEQKKYAASPYVKFMRGRIVLALFDDTVFGGGEDGFLITYAGVSGHNMYEDNVLEFKWNEIEEVTHGADCIYVNGQKIDLKYIESETNARLVVKMICALRDLYVKYWESYGDN